MRDLRNVYWIGGGSGAGKSTVARRLAADHGLALYATDDVMGEHARRSTARDSPRLHEFMAMDMDQRWVTRSPRTMLDTFHWFAGEGFGSILHDLPDRPVVAEGFRLLPELVAPLAAPGRAVWLLPTPGFRRAAFESRGSLWTIAGATGDPPRALRNLLERDALFTDRLRRQTRELGVPVIELDGGATADEVYARVARMFGLSTGG